MTPHAATANARTAEPTVVEVAVNVIEARLTHVSEALQLSASGRYDVEAVHQLRVAARRAEAALELFAEFLEPVSAREIRHAITSIRHAADAARDLDVRQEWIRDGKIQETRQSRARDRQLRRQADRSLARAANRYSSKSEFARQCEQAIAFLSAAALTRDAAKQPFGRWAAGRLHDLRREFRQRCRQISDRTRKLHRFRIAAKRLRYNLEVLAPAFDREQASRVLLTLEKLQRKLGTLQDHAVLRRHYRDLAEEGPAKSRRLDGKLAEQQGRVVRSLRRRFRSWWDRSRQKRFFRELKALAPSPVEHLPSRQDPRTVPPRFADVDDASP